MEKKKILHIVESFGSGVFSFLVDLINCTDEEFDITVAYGVRDETLENFKEYFSDRVKFINVKNFARSINPVKDIKSFFEIKKIIKEVNPDIIHLHSSKAGFVGRFAANGRKIKIMYNPHGFSFLMKDSSKLKRVLYWCLEKIGALRKCTIVGCSQGEYEEALKLSKNSICINNGINITELDNIKNTLKKCDKTNEMKICTIGRIEYQKNPYLFNKIAEKFPMFKFTWIGDGSMRNVLKSPNIEITGWKTREECIEILNKSDIFVLVSYWEGLPISLLEAMYLEKVCLVSNCIGNKDVIQDKENGFIINEENFENVIKGINENLYTKISSNAKKSVCEKYDAELMIENYRKVYQDKC